MSVGLSEGQLKSRVIQKLKNNFVFSKDEKTFEAIAEAVASVISDNNKKIEKELRKLRSEIN